jgi:hypothetical protein
MRLSDRCEDQEEPGLRNATSETQLIRRDPLNRARIRRLRRRDVSGSDKSKTLSPVDTAPAA